MKIQKYILTPNRQYVKLLIPTNDEFASTLNLTRNRLYKVLATSIFKGGVWDTIPNWVDNGRQGILFLDFFPWAFGGASYVASLPIDQRQKWKNDVLKGESGKNLGWMRTETKMDEHDYPVDFPNGKRAPVVLQIHETSYELMKQPTVEDKKL